MATDCQNVIGLMKTIWRVLSNQGCAFALFLWLILKHFISDADTAILVASLISATVTPAIYWGYVKIRHKLIVKQTLEDLGQYEMNFLKKRFSVDICKTIAIRKNDEYKVTRLIEAHILVKSSYGIDEEYIGYSLSEAAIKCIKKHNLL